MIAGGDVTPLQHEDPPILVCADLQIEYLGEGEDAVTSRCGVLLGFSLDETVLSTVVDGFHRSHRYQVVADAVACRHGGIGDAASYKQSVIKVIGNFAGILRRDDLIGASGRIAV